MAYGFAATLPLHRHKSDGLKRSAHAHDIRNFKGGQLKIACLPALAMGFMPRVIKAFVTANPEVTIQLQARSTSTVHPKAPAGLGGDHRDAGNT